MIRQQRLEHRFVEHIPEQLDPGLLYISMEYGTAAHLCCCGCNSEIVTPFSLTDWHMTFDGESVSLWPSIGNWSLPCRSHYIIDRGKVREAPEWSKDQVEFGRRWDKRAKAQYYGGDQVAPSAEERLYVVTVNSEDKLLARLKRWWRG